MPARKKKAENCAEIVREIAKLASGLLPEGYECVVVAINAVEGRAAIASTHEAAGESMTEAELERAYRHFWVAEQMVVETIERIEEKLPEDVVVRAAPKTSSVQSPSNAVRKEYKN